MGFIKTKLNVFTINKMPITTKTIEITIKVYYTHNLSQEACYNKIKSNLTMESDLLEENTLKSQIASVYSEKPCVKKLYEEIDYHHLIT